ncbi:MAG: 30S ribosomal protein S12 methylthiotransferase RimO [Desulfobacterales bacterium]
MNVYFESLGCARNQVDSEILIGRLINAGCRISESPQHAEVIVVNTCSFIEDAAQESIDAILSLAAYKALGACRFLIVIGCLPQRYQKDISESLPEVDLFLGTGAFAHLLPAVLNVPHTSGALFPKPDRPGLLDCSLRTRLDSKPAAYIKIAEGCDKHCTYCIIPKLRGRQKSRPPADIIREARGLISAGIKELVLVAQETTFYGNDFTPKMDLSHLLAELAVLEGDIRIRVLYGHPLSMSNDLIKTIASHSKLCSYFDMPIQHASDRILKQMGRGYTSRDLYDTIEQIRRHIPDAALRTTVITGFPGESDSDFRKLTDFLEDVRFHHLGAFTYSDADDLAAHRLPNKVHPKKASRRYDHIMSLQQQISEDIQKTCIGSKLRVLIEEKPEKGLFVGRTDFQAPEVDGVVYIDTGKQLSVGDFADIRIVDALEYDLMGEPA